MSDVFVTVQEQQQVVSVQNTPIQVSVSTPQNPNLSSYATYNQLVNTSGVLQTEITQTGATLLSLIHASSAGVSTLNGQSGNLNITGTGMVVVTIDGQNIVISGISGASGGGGGTGVPSINNISSAVFITGTGNLSVYVASDTLYISGNYNDAINISGNLQSTGSTLYNLIIGSATNLSGNIQNTGNSLYNYILGLSGNLQQTGSNLYGIIYNKDNPSGFLNFALTGISVTGGQTITGLVNLTGIGGLVIFQSGLNTIFFSGGGTVTNVGSAGFTGVTGISATGSNSITGLINFLTIGGMAIIYSGDNNIVLSGGAASVTNNNFFSYYYFASGVTGISVTGGVGVTGLINFTGVSGVSIVQSGNTIIFTDIVSGALQQQINSLTNNLQSTGQSLYVLLTNASGQFNANFATIQNLQTTGQNLYNLLVNESGQIYNDLATKQNLQNTGQALYTLLVNESGVFNISGQALENQINSLSGYSNNTFATIANLTQTGITLLSLISAASAGVSSIDGKSGILTFTGAGNVSVIVNGQTFIFSGDVSTISGFLQSQINTLTTNLQSTGQNLYNLLVNESGVFNNSGQALEAQINSLSGYSNNTFATIVNLGSTGHQLFVIETNNANNLSGNLTQTGANLSAVKVTGSSIINVANFTGVGGTLVIWSGNYILVSGAGIGGGTNVQVSGSAILSTANFSGIGTAVVIQSGNYVLVSGAPQIAPVPAPFTGVTGLAAFGYSSLTGTVLVSGSGNICVSQVNNIIQISITGSGSYLPVVFGNINLPSGGDGTGFIPFGQTFPAIPIVIGSVVNNSGDAIIAVQISGITTSGFGLNFSDTLTTVNYYYDFMATTGSGGYNLFTSNIGVGSSQQTVQSGGSLTLIGSGSPEGVVSATSGTLYMDWFNATLYMKLTGVGVNGWN